MREAKRMCRNLWQTYLFNTAASQDLLDCKHSKANNFKKEREGGLMQITV